MNCFLYATLASPWCLLSWHNSTERCGSVHPRRRCGIIQKHTRAPTPQRDIYAYMHTTHIHSLMLRSTPGGNLLQTLTTAQLQQTTEPWLPVPKRPELCATASEANIHKAGTRHDPIVRACVRNFNINSY